MNLDYERPPQATNTNHDHIYTTLLGVTAFLLIIGMSTIAWLRMQPRTVSEAKSALLLPLFVEGCYLAAVVGVLLIRIFATSIRRWPTFGLNLILLLFFPFGTILAIYGLLKVDKKLPPT